MALEVRPATADDADEAYAVSTTALATYSRFAPGWSGPPETVAGVRDRLATGWGAVALDSGVVVGFAAFEPARQEARSGPLVPGLGHVWAVFVAESHWGAGVATALLEALVAEMRRWGLTEARLFTPALHARARSFYAREGWREQGPAVPAPELGLDVVELRRALGGRGDAASPTRPCGRSRPSAAARP